MDNSNQLLPCRFILHQLLLHCHPRFSIGRYHTMLDVFVPGQLIPRYLIAFSVFLHQVIISKETPNCEGSAAIIRRGLQLILKRIVDIVLMLSSLDLGDIQYPLMLLNIGEILAAYSCKRC